MSNLRNAKVEWHIGYGNNPGFKLLVEEDNYEDHTYEERNGIYLSILPNGMVSFFYYKRPDDGFGGRTFTLKMKDGTERKLHGPWSSNSSSVNSVFPESQVAEAAYTSDPNAFDRGFTFYAGSVTVDTLIEAAKICGVNLVRAKFNHGTYVVPSMSTTATTKPHYFKKFKDNPDYVPGKWGSYPLAKDEHGRHILEDEGYEITDQGGEIIDVLYDAGEVSLDDALALAGVERD